MRATVRALLRLILLLTPVVIITGAFWFGLVPQRLSPFAPIELNQPENWFVDPRLAALRHDPQLCRAVLIAPTIDATPITDDPVKNGCGWTNAVRLATAGSAKLSSDKISCELAAALALWIEHEVQPAAQKHLGQHVKSLQSFGTYACRNIVGNRALINVKSQHATANAIDITGFTLADGSQITIAKNWTASTASAAFLHDIHDRSCRYFRASLSPDFNAAHHDHFHLDRGPLWRCK